MEISQGGKIFEKVSRILGAKISQERCLYWLVQGENGRFSCPSWLFSGVFFKKWHFRHFAQKVSKSPVFGVFSPFFCRKIKILMFKKFFIYQFALFFLLVI